MGYEKQVTFGNPERTTTVTANYEGTNHVGRVEVVENTDLSRPCPCGGAYCDNQPYPVQVVATYTVVFDRESGITESFRCKVRNGDESLSLAERAHGASVAGTFRKIGLAENFWKTPLGEFVSVEALGGLSRAPYTPVKAQILEQVFETVFEGSSAAVAGFDGKPTQSASEPRSSRGGPESAQERALDRRQEKLNSLLEEVFTAITGKATKRESPETQVDERLTANISSPPKNRS